MQRNKCSHKT